MLLSLPLLLLLSTHFAFSLANLPTAVGPNGAATLLAPVYRNVTADDVWVYPNSSFDLGARSMGCECFDPSGIRALSPFMRVSLTKFDDRDMLYAHIDHDCPFLYYTKYYLLCQHILSSW